VSDRMSLPIWCNTVYLIQWWQYLGHLTKLMIINISVTMSEYHKQSQNCLPFYLCQSKHQSRPVTVVTFYLVIHCKHNQSIIFSLHMWVCVYVFCRTILRLVKVNYINPFKFLSQPACKIFLAMFSLVNLKFIWTNG